MISSVKISHAWIQVDNLYKELDDLLIEASGQDWRITYNRDLIVLSQICVALSTGRRDKQRKS